MKQETFERKMPMLGCPRNLVNVSYKWVVTYLEFLNLNDQVIFGTDSLTKQSSWDIQLEHLTFGKATDWSPEFSNMAGWKITKI